MLSRSMDSAIDIAILNQSYKKAHSLKVLLIQERAWGWQCQSPAHLPPRWTASPYKTSQCGWL